MKNETMRKKIDPTRNRKAIKINQFTWRFVKTTFEYSRMRIVSDDFDIYTSMITFRIANHFVYLNVTHSIVKFNRTMRGVVSH